MSPPVTACQGRSNRYDYQSFLKRALEDPLLMQCGGAAAKMLRIYQMVSACCSWTD